MRSQDAAAELKRVVQKSPKRHGVMWELLEVFAKWKIQDQGRTAAARAARAAMLQERGRSEEKTRESASKARAGKGAAAASGLWFPTCTT